MAQMEHSTGGNIGLGVCLIAGILARIDVSQALKEVSVIISIIAGIMAIRYYYISSKQKLK